MRAVLVLAIVGGCHAGDPFACKTSAQCSVDVGGTCEPAGFCSFADPGCDSGRRYDPSAGSDLAGICVPTVDGDHDGVADTADNCPTVFNPMQENEDGDPFGDACDPCPPFPELTPPSDADNDGVSDLCDPHIDPVKADHIVLFEGFHHGLPAAWTAVGAWTAISDGVHFDSLATASTLSISVAPSVGVMYVYTDLALATHGTSDGDVGLTLGPMHCGLEEKNGMTNQQVVLRDTGGTLGQTSYNFGANIYVMAQEWDPAAHQWACLVEDVATGLSATTGGTKASTNLITVGVSSSNMSGRFGFVMVVAQ